MCFKGAVGSSYDHPQLDGDNRKLGKKIRINKIGPCYIEIAQCNFFEITAVERTWIKIGLTYDPKASQKRGNKNQSWGSGNQKEKYKKSGKKKSSKRKRGTTSSTLNQSL